MIAGLPWDAWALLLVAVGAGLAVQLTAWWAHRHDVADPEYHLHPDESPDGGAHRGDDADRAGPRSGREGTP